MGYVWGAKLDRVWSCSSMFLQTRYHTGLYRNGCRTLEKAGEAANAALPSVCFVTLDRSLNLPEPQPNSNKPTTYGASHRPGPSSGLHSLISHNPLHDPWMLIHLLFPFYRHRNGRLSPKTPALSTGHLLFPYARTQEVIPPQAWPSGPADGGSGQELP